jgi:hypothetical protein
MRLAVLRPFYIRIDQTRNYDGYNAEFIRQQRPLIYLPGWKPRLTRARRWRNEMRQHGFPPDDYEFVHSLAELNRRADVLVCFNSAPCCPENRPPAGFKGLKIWHVMDFNYRAAECYRALRDGGVHYVMAYTRLDRYCDFFRRYYPGYIDKVIPVPFGFGKRFENGTPFEQRTMKAVVMGAVNPTDQNPPGQPPTMPEYAAFYREFPFSQMWRHTLRQHESELEPVLESFLPKIPEISRPGDDPVVLLNRYAMYANDESICGFPPARTYEGAACGAAMVSSDHECFRDIGFEDGVNCIMHRPLDVADFREKVAHYLERPAELKEIARRGCEMVRSRYTHEQVARQLYEDIRARWPS